MHSGSIHKRDKSKSKYKRKSRGKSKSKRGYFTHEDYSSEPWNVAGSSRDYFNGRPRWLTGRHDPYLRYLCEPQPFYTLEDDNDDERCYHRPSRKRSSSKRSSRDCIARGVRTDRERELPVIRGWDRDPDNWDHCSSRSSRKRSKSIVAGWKEGFSTISEEPTKEAAEQAAYYSSSSSNCPVTTTKTRESCGPVEDFSPTVVGSARMDRIVVEHLRPTTECSLPRAFSVTSTLDKLVTKSGSNASCGEEIVLGPDHQSFGTAQQSEQTTVWSRAFGRLRLFFGKLRPMLSTNGDRISIKNIVSKFHIARPKYVHEILEEEPVPIPTDEQVPAPDVSGRGEKTTGQELPRVPALYKQLVQLESMVDRDRKCALVLAVGLLTAAFLLASAFSSSRGFGVALPPEQSREKAVNAESDVNANAANTSDKTQHTSAADGAATMSRLRTTSARSSKNNSFFSLKNYADNSTDPVTEVMHLSSLLISNENSKRPKVTGESFTASSEDVSSSLVNQPMLFGDKDALSYDGNTTSADNDVF